MPSGDEAFMARALALASQARFWASPNPHVGCVLVRDGAVIGEGFTQPAGGNHAEIEALNNAGDAAAATAYVTLEPCAHTGRTGPCVEALIAAGIERVVVAISDPNPAVNGAGIDRLRAAGIEVSHGVMAAEAAQQLAGFLLRMQRGWGRIRLKIAASLDGRTAMASGQSQWITGSDARADVQCLRAESCAIVTGIGTVLSDDCALTVRAESLPLTAAEVLRATTRTPLRVVLDRRARTPIDARITAPEAPTLLLTAAVTDKRYGDTVSTEVLPENGSGGLDLSAVAALLGARGANEILVEAGPTLAAGFLQSGLVDELIIYQAPRLLGASARPLVALDLERLEDAPRLRYTNVSSVGSDLRIVAKIVAD